MSGFCNTNTKDTKEHQLKKNNRNTHYVTFVRSTDPEPYGSSWIGVARFPV